MLFADVGVLSRDTPPAVRGDLLEADCSSGGCPLTWLNRER